MFFVILIFVIRLNDDSGINEKFLSLTTGEKYRNTKGIRIYGYFIHLSQNMHL